MSVGREQVEAAVQVIVEEKQAEFQWRLGRCPQSKQVGEVRELERRRLVADIQGRHLVGEIADGQTDPFVVREGRPIDAHSTTRRARLVERDARDNGDLLKLALALIVKEEILNRVVGHGDIDPAVAIDVVRRHAERLADRHFEVGRAHLNAGTR